MQILPILSTQNKLLGNENKANDHAQKFIKDKKQNSPNLFIKKTKSLGEFSNGSNGVFWAEARKGKRRLSVKMIKNSDKGRVQHSCCGQV